MGTTRLVAIIGPRASGKTTLIEAIHRGCLRKTLGIALDTQLRETTEPIDTQTQPTIYHLDTRMVSRWKQPEIRDYLNNADKTVILIRSPEQLRFNMQQRLSRAKGSKKIQQVQRDLAHYQDDAAIHQHNANLIAAFPDALQW